MRQAYERPFQPVDTTDATVTSFSMLDMTRQLMTEDSFNKTGRNALTLTSGNDLTLVLMVLKNQSMLHEHTAPGPITLTVLSGHIEFSVATAAEPLGLRPGEAAVCAAHLAHRVKALEDSAFLLVIGGRV